MSERKAFKDYFDRTAARALAVQIKAAYPSFDETVFVQKATRKISELEFQGRVQQFADALAATLPPQKAKAMRLLKKSLPPPLPDCESVTDGWLQWPLGQFVATHGSEAKEAAFDLMIELTQRFSSEFAVRPFVESDPEATCARLLALTDHENPHVRRWCSEGCRTRLPWGRKLHGLINDPTPIWPILEALKDDPQLYVRKSVANNLNDLTKDHPDAVIKRLRGWKKEAGGGRSWIIRHALRTLVKDGHPDALSLLGFGPPTDLDVSLRLKPKTIAIGETVGLEARIISRSSTLQNLMVDYVVHYVRTSGTNEKVFKWKQLKVAPGEGITLEHNHSMKVTTIRRLLPGKHRVEVQVNGVRMGEAVFTLRD